MNKTRRRRLEACITTLQEIEYEEREAYENMPDSLRDSEKGEAMEICADTIAQACSDLEELVMI